MTDFRESWSGPLGPVNLPTGQLHGIVASLRFDANDDPEAQISSALKPVLGQARIKHHALVLRSLTWSKSRWEVEASWKRGRLVMKAKSLKKSQLESLLVACKWLPNARDLHVRGRQ